MFFRRFHLCHKLIDGFETQLKNASNRNLVISEKMELAFAGM